ncbi:LOW QUALITY PROTEIN: dedicator of cytokinesis protein 9-like [Pollicipes pollicipes]|uniref:LOW QUALITY PROTEIN: dedicator of cytokinesis protein 9-like n=1 Tax=Pollicipes pollicipes TaxID=41117 RepID=UPI001884C531|nr:LOW QUALITY PROTEIN: dedicator of cytokinesis protein 9-like [Pollicipes pollicipes]
MERKFTKVLSRPGMAAQLRENVSQAVKETTIQTQRHITEPLDYETYVSKNMTILRNDPHRELLLFPLDDVEQHSREQHSAALGTSLEQQALERAERLVIRQCLETYTARLVSVKYKYDAYAGTYLQLPRFPRAPTLAPYVCEADLDVDCTDSLEVQAVSKSGFLLRGTDGAGDKLFAKSFKRRFARLRQGADGSYVLEFYKDSKSSESKGAIPLDLVAEVVKHQKRGKHSFELRTTDGGKAYLLTTETEAELLEWVQTVGRAVALTKDDRLSVASDVSATDSSGSTLPASSDERFGTLRGLDQSLNPQLNRYAHETDYMIGQARGEGRLPVFQLYPDIQSTPLSTASCADHLRTEPFSEVHGVTVLVRCESLQFRLQMPVDDTAENLSQIEPYFTSLCLYDAKQGRKISEEFFFDVNDPYIRNLLPKAVSKHKETGTTLLPDLIHAPLEWLSYPRQALFTVQQPHSEIFLVVRVEKVLQGSVAVSCDQYSRPADAKHLAKMHCQIRQSCDRLGGYRMPFAWSARPLFRSTADLDPADFAALYRHEPNRMTDEDILKLLQDWRKPDKLSRLSVIPGSLKVSVQLHGGQPLENCLSPSLVPLRPFAVPPSSPPTLWLQTLPAPAPELASPHTGYTNLLYVYPRRLKYDAQKTFKARNIACRVELRQGDDEASAPLQCFYARPGQGASYVTSQMTSVLHHETNPSWGAEIKLGLPLAIDERHHLLFTFYHVSCQPKTAKRGQEAPDTPVGYSWIPLLSKGRLNLDTQTVAVASYLPAGYLAVEPLGLGKGYAGPGIHWVDGQKPLFKVTFRLVSTVYTTDQHLHNFFLHAHRLRETRMPTVHASDNETTKQVKVVHHLPKILKALHAIDVATLIRFLPTLLNQLLRILVSSDSDDVVQNTLRVLTHVITTLHQVGRQRLVDIYTRHVLAEWRLPPSGQTCVHEALCRGLCQLLQPSNMDFLLVHKLLRHSSSLFDIIMKSMALHLLNSGRIKMQRHERFTASFNKQLETMLESFYPYILQKYKELPLETREANRSMAALLKRCLSLMDRGFVFRLITSYLEKFSLADPRLLWEYKFEFLQMVCAHEHYIQLNLPIFNPARTSIRSLHDFQQEYFMSESFSAKHYLTGLMLHELRLALSQIPDVRRMAIHAVRDLVVKHAYDDRYQTKGQKARIATLYFPLVGILLEHLHRLEAAVPAAPATAAGTGSAVSRAASHRSTATWQTSYSWAAADGTSSLGNRNRFAPNMDLASHARVAQRESTYLAYIAGQSQQASESSAASTISLASTASSQTDTTVESAVHAENGDASSQRALELGDTDSQPGGKRSTHNRTLSTAHDPGALYRYDKLLPGEARDLLVCFLHVVRHVPDELLVTWWKYAAEDDVVNFFTLVQMCLCQFRYSGGLIRAHPRVSEVKKAFTLPARMDPAAAAAGGGAPSEPVLPEPAGGGGGASAVGATPPHLASEVALVALDLACLYSAHFSERVAQRGGQNAQMALLTDVYLGLLHPGQSEAVLRHAFAALRMFVQHYSAALYHGPAELCGRLCYDLLRCCNSPLASTRHEACALLYLLMRGNFEFTNRKAFTRVHLQVIIKVSQLLGESVVLDSSQFYESLSLINSYANSDKVMTRTGFVSDVKDLTKRVRTVLMATAQLKEHENDPAVLVDLQHSLANSYASTPQLRETWLRSMAKCHVRDGNLSEAAMCQVHIAALMAEYLLQRGEHELGCQAFHAVSANVVRDENNLKFDLGIGDLCYTEESLVAQLKVCAEAMELCERQELLPNVYDILVPIYRRRRSYGELAEAHHHMHRCYNRIVQLNISGRRLLGTYFRVICLGQNYFDKDHDREYVYKEPKVTCLAEVSDKLYHLHCHKFGKENVRIIKDSAPVVMADLDPRLAYIQVTHLTPHWDDVDLDARPTEFERNNNIKQFMYETPFTRGGGPRGPVEQQWRRRTVLTTDYCFPYVRTRIPVIRRQEYELSPIEVAIDEMTRRSRELVEVVERQPTDVKKLQLRLQGSVSVQVNAGPLAYASAFLEESVRASFPGDKLYQLKQAFREFVDACQRALSLNAQLRADDQADYHGSLEAGFQDLVAALGLIVGESFPVKTELARHSQHLSGLFLLSSMTGSSSV